MPGVRIRLTESARRQAGLTQLAPAQTGLLWIVRDVTRPRIPYECGYCTKREQALKGWKAQPVFHDAKTYHLELDADLTRTVSETVWDRLRRLYDNGGFELANEVAKPPDQKLILPTVKVSLTPSEL